MRLVLMYSLAPPSPEHLERLRALDPGLEVVVVEDEAGAIAAVAEAEVILGHRFLRQSLPRARRLRWVQTSAGGVDRLPLAELAARGVWLTRSALGAPIVAAHALALAWAVSRRLPEAWAHQQAHAWEPRLAFPPLPRRALVLGRGAIGTAIAGQLRALGIATVVASHRPSGLPSGVGSQSWREALAEADWCFLAMPHATATVRLFDEAALRRLPPHAVLVNVGRGETLDTQALLRVLDEGHLSGAALDVLEREPPDREDPIWGTPRLLITPHVGAHASGQFEATERFFEEQVRRYLAGEPLEQVVDLARALGAAGFPVQVARP